MSSLRLLLSVTLFLFTTLTTLAFAVERNQLAFHLKLAAAPDSTYQLLTGEIQKASKTIQMNVYELSNPAIADLLLEKARAGVKIQLILEGQPVGGFKKESKTVIQKLLSSTSAKNIDLKVMYNLNRLDDIDDTDEKASSRKFRFNHAKYSLIDSEILVLGSENYGKHGHPQKGVDEGNRGWAIATTDVGTINYFAAIFKKDFQANEYLNPKDALFKKLFLATTADFDSKESEDLPSKVAHNTLIKSLTSKECAIKPVSSPENSLTALVQLVSNAKRTLSIELMSFSPLWSESRSNHYPSPLLVALDKALDRGVEVKILLNDPSSFFRRKSLPSMDDVVNDNHGTYETLHKMQKNHPTLEVMISNNSEMGVTYIHNKGVIADGTQTLVSSINWTQTSLTKNREAAVIISCASAATFYQQLFNLDWNRSK